MFTARSCSLLPLTHNYDARRSEKRNSFLTKASTSSSEEEEEERKIVAETENSIRQKQQQLDEEEYRAPLSSYDFDIGNERIKTAATTSKDVWETKPFWCQPWSIISTGIVIISAPEVLFHSTWVSLLISIPIATWWYIFLYSYPKAYSEGEFYE
jgi:hypothetical protein